MISLRILPALGFLLMPSLALAITPVWSCAPYQCVDGTHVARCSADGTPINYFAAPCLTHRGEIGAQSFSDVPTTHENADAIAYVQAQGIVSGYPDGTYRPDAKINRAEFTKIVIGSSFDSTTMQNCDKTSLNYFDDVDGKTWYASYVCVGYENGILIGHLRTNAKPTFSPTEEINTVEAAKIIAATYNIGLPPLDCAHDAAMCMQHAQDGDIWYKRHIDALAEKNAIPTSIGSFEQYLTRGEMAEMIYRLKTGNTSKPSQTYENLALAGSVPSDEIAFDSCGSLSSYSGQEWYADFIKQALTAANTTSTANFSEACLSLDGDTFIAIYEGAYCEGSKVFQYPTKAGLLEEATLTIPQKERTCSDIRTFEKRIGDIIPLRGGGGSEGCSAQYFYDYDYNANTVRMTKAIWQCFGDQQATVTTY